MFLKNALSNCARRIRTVFFSITLRLTLLYALSAFVILFISTTFLYFALVRSLTSEDNQYLIENIQKLRAVLRHHSHNVPLIEQEVRKGGDFHFIKYYARVADERGSVIAETPDKNIHLPASYFPPPVEPRVIPTKSKSIRLPDGSLYLLMSAWAEGNGSGGDKLLIQSALDVSLEDQIILRYRETVTGVVLIGIFLSSIAGILIARRGMHPLGKITKVVQRIKASQLGERVNPSQWPQELTALATSFDEMLTRLSDSFNRLSQFSSDLAHELRTPINNLMGEAEVALAKARTEQEYQQILASSLEEYKRLSRMIESLLFLARAECTDIKVEPAVFDPVKEIEAILEYYDALAEDNSLTITCRGNASLKADPLLFRRAVTNILSNAIRFTPPGGTIDIAVSESTDHSTTVSISDTGIGIPAEEVPSIFKRFYRGSRARSMDSEGSGLGLAIVKSIMDLHGGAVTIQSKPSQGTTVTLRFPSVF